MSISASRIGNVAPVAFYMDVHIPKAITTGLRLRGVDVVTAQEDKASALNDSDMFDLADRVTFLPL